MAIDIAIHDAHPQVDWREARRRYKIIRHYFKGGKRTIMTGLSLAEAQAHCGNPDTSSSTATSAAAKRITRRNGAWFDGYTEE